MLCLPLQYAPRKPPCAGSLHTHLCCLTRRDRRRALRSDGDGEVIGAVQLINKLDPRSGERMPFDKRDLHQCNAISMQIGLALMNIRHREQVEIYQDMLTKQMTS